MKRILFVLWCLGCYAAMSQNLDVTAYSQNIALKDTVRLPVTEQVQQLAPYPSITEVYQIPSYELYDRYWDVTNLRSRKLDIPFVNDRLMLLLVQASNNPFEAPCSFSEVTQKFGVTKKGDFHPGVDLLLEPQTLVKICFDGVVRMACYYGDYGLTVVVRHYNGLETVYAHLDKICVKPGQILHAGNVIGQAGMTGNVKDCRLHFEMRFMNEYFDPEIIIDFENGTLIKNSLVLTPDEFYLTALSETSKTESEATRLQETVKPASVMPKQQPQTLAPEVTPKQPQPIIEGEALYHIVKRGETLYRIALTYQTTVAKIIGLNDMIDPDKICEGQRIRVQ